MAVSALHSLLGQIPSSALMTSPVKTAYARWPVTRLVDFLLDNGMSGAPVISSDGAMVGVVSISDVLRAGAKAGAESEAAHLAGYREDTGLGYEVGKEQLARLLRSAGGSRPVSEIMTPAVIHVEAATPVLEALRLMHDRKIHRVFVMNGGRLVGMIDNNALLAGLVSPRPGIAA